MKFAKHLNFDTLTPENLQKVKGGQNLTTVIFETMVEITTTLTNGETEMLYCDRRKKKVNC